MFGLNRPCRFALTKIMHSIKNTIKIKDYQPVNSGFFIMKKIQLIISILWLTALTCVYLLPSFSTETIKENLHLEVRLDYVLHLAAFSITGIIFFFNRKKQIVLFWFSFFCIYSYGMELLQKYYFHRTFNKYDILSNCIGLLIALFLIKYLKKIKFLQQFIN